LGAITKFPSPPPLSQRARGDKILPRPLGEGRGEGVNLDILSLLNPKSLQNNHSYSTTPVPIMVQANNTELLLDEDLMELGIPKAKIIPGFVPAEALAYPEPAASPLAMAA